MSGGFIGVDVFFVISGFLITQLLQEELEKTSQIRLRDFYARRMRRLLPALVLVLIIMIFLWVLFLAGLSDTRKFSRSFTWALFGGANIFFSRNTGGYFDGPTGDMPLLHLWSLAVEEQFYLFWPLYLIVLFYFSRWIKKQTKAVYLVGILSVTVLSFGWSAYLMTHGLEKSAFFMMPARAWELGVGSILAIFGPLPNRIRFSYFFSSIGLIFVLSSVFIFSSATPFPGVSALLPVLGTGLIIYGGANFESNPIKKFFSSSLCVHIGKLSYGWYLWHWPVFVFFRLWNLGEEPKPLIRFLGVIFSLILSEISLRYFENLIRYGNKSLSLSSFRVIGVGFLTLLSLGAMGAFIPQVEVEILRKRFGNERVKGVLLTREFGNDCFELDAIGSDKCDFDFSKRKDGRNNIVSLWGDSHACSYFPLLTDLAKENEIQASLYCIGNTPPLAPNLLSEAVFADVKKKLSEKLDQPISLSFILVARWLKYTPLEISTGLEKSLAQLKSLGVERVLVLLPYIEFSYTTFQCAVKGEDRCTRSLVEFEKQRADVVNALKKVVEKYPFARTLDPLPSVCREGLCPTVLDEIPATIDTNHPSFPAVRRLGREFSDDLHWLAGKKMEATH